MRIHVMRCIALALALALTQTSFALDRPDVTFKIFQFPPDKIPQIDAKADDWAIVPDSYIIGSDQLVNDSAPNQKPDPKNLDVKVKVGWVKGENRLYFLYQAFDDVCEFGPDGDGFHNDILEIAVDGDKSGGNFLARNHPDKTVDLWDAWFLVQDIQAQNYHVFTPAVDKDWCMAWGPQATWIKQMPWSNAASSTTAKPGGPGNVTAEFWITPFDLASPDGPEKSKVTKLVEGNTIGLSFMVMDYDDPKSDKHSFWNLSRHHTAYGDSTYLCSFKLMPLEPQFLKKIDAQWSFKLADEKQRIVAFHDDSIGKVTSWKWDFGDKTTSAEQNPQHTYKDPGNFIVSLEIEGPDGKSKRQKVWDVTLK